MRKKLLYLITLLLPPLLAVAQSNADLQKALPSDWGGWQNLTYGVADSVLWDSHPKPLQVQMAGSYVHVAWMEDAKQNDGEYPLYYRRSTDYGKTWEKAKIIARDQRSNWTSSSTGDDIAGHNSHWMVAEGKNVHFLVPRLADDGLHSVTYYYSTDYGKTFKQKELWKQVAGKGHIFPSRPHVAVDGKNVVLAVNIDRTVPYVWTSTDGGATFKECIIDASFKIVDLQVSGKRWTILGTWSDGGAYTRVERVFFATSADAGKNVTIKDLGHEAANGNTYSLVETNAKGNSCVYNPQLVQQGDIIDVLYQGSLSDGNDGDPDPRYDKSHTLHRRSTDGGKTWSGEKYIPESTGSHGTIAAKGDNVYIVSTKGDKHGLYYSHDGGKNWTWQESCSWNVADQYNVSRGYQLYIAPDDASGRHVFLTGPRMILFETKDGFSTLSRSFCMGQEAWDSKHSNNHQLSVLLDDKGAEHWFLGYATPHKGFSDYDPWYILHRTHEAEPATGKQDMALDLTNTRDEFDNRGAWHQVTVPMTPSLSEIRKATTVECWVRVDEMKSFQISSLCHDTEKSLGSVYRGGFFMSVSMWGSNDNYFTFDAGLTTDKSADTQGVSLRTRRYLIYDTGYWHHLAITYDAGAGADNFRFYIDGMLMAYETMVGDILMGKNPLVIGAEGNDNTQSKALVDNFAIWDRALSQQEIQEHIFNPPTGRENNCRLLLTFDGSLKDQSPYGNDGMAFNRLVLTPHDGIRPPKPEMILSKDMTGKIVSFADASVGGEASFWLLPYNSYPGYYDYYKGNGWSKKTGGYQQIDFDKNSGTYYVNLITRGTGDCNAYATVEQSFTIGGLSKVEPSVVGKSDYMGIRIFGGYQLNSKTKPKVFIKQGSTVIEGTWDMPDGYDHTKVTNAADMAMAHFDMTGQPTGQYDVIVGTDTLYKALQVEAGQYPDVWCQIGGGDKMLMGKWKNFTIEYGNPTNAPAYNVPLFLFFDDKDGKLEVSFDFEVIKGSDAFSDEAVEALEQLGDYALVTDEQGNSIGVRGYAFLVPYVAPNSVNQRTFRLRLPADYPGDREVNVVAAVYDSFGAFSDDDVAPDKLNRALDEDDKELIRMTYNTERINWANCVMEYIGWGVIGESISVVPFMGCFYNSMRTSYAFQFEDAGTPERWSNLLWNSGGMLISCATDAFPPTLAAKCFATLIAFAWNGVANYQTLKGCLAGKKTTKKIKGVFSYDPNEMIGPWGYDDVAHYIQPIHQMPYTVTFENKASASAPAHEVFVTDTLDAARYDLSSFSFTAFGWADKHVSLNEWGCKAFTRDVAYTVGGKNIIVRVSAQYDETTGVARWSFASLDKSGNEIDDPDLGFLVPNNDNGDGEGFVAFTVNHKEGLATKSRISNKATIVFDVNAPITTNTYTNTIDTDYPTSSITGLKESDGKIAVSFKGKDGTSGVASFNVFAFKNGGEPELVAGNITGSKVNVPCEPGTHYGFCVIATDNVGYNEPKDIVPEMDITTSGTSTATTVTVQVAEAGYATFYDSQLDFQLPAGLKASVVSGYSNQKLSYQTLSDGVVPKGVAVLLEADSKKAAAYTLTSTEGASPYTGSNMLYGSDAATTTAAPGDNIYYKLAYGPSGTALASAFGWFWGAQNGAAFLIEGHRAWLAIPKNAAAPAYLLEGDETDIADFSYDATEPQSYFDLQGRRIQRPTAPGIYLYGNRKVVIRKTK